MRIRYTVAFDGTWRVGSGEAAGRHLDSLIRRDGAGLPFLPGPTVRGVVGDAVHTLVELLEIEHCDGTLRRDRPDEPAGRLCGVTRETICPLCRLTGSPAREPAVDWGPARMVLEGTGGAVWDPEERRAVGRQMEAVPGLLTQPHPRTAIDARSGRADDEHLFALEEVRADVELEGTLEIREPVSALDVALLVGGLRWVREMGGGRRRGQGSCRIRIDEADLVPLFEGWEEALDRLPALAPGGRETERRASSQDLASRAPRPSGEAVPEDGILAVEAMVVGEVVLGRRPDAGNVIPGLAFVPGSVLRGALAARWRSSKDGEPFARAFLQDRIRYGFLYPLSGSRASRPVSLAVHTCKLRPGRRPEGDGLVDLLELPAGEDERCRECGGRLEPVAPEFEGVAEEDTQLLLSPHNRIDREHQTVRVGSLFAYEALPEGRRLRGFLRAESPEDLASLLRGTGLSMGESFRLRVGRRKGALGYLEVRLTRLSGNDSGIGVFPDGEPVPSGWPDGTGLRIELLTPAILLDEHLRHRRTVEPRDLGLDREGFTGEIAAAEVLSGWNGAHSLPKPDEVVVAAGSTFILERQAADEPAEAELATLRRAAREGIGQRRAEGFGAIQVTTAKGGAGS